MYKSKTGKENKIYCHTAEVTCNGPCALKCEGVCQGLRKEIGLIDASASKTHFSFNFDISDSESLIHIIVSVFNELENMYA